MLDRRRLLLVDNRGTGKSAPIVCRKLQSYTGNRNNAIGRCGRRLGATSDLYASAFAADDLAAVLDHLRIKKVDLYGDSYGTFFSQAFEVRHPTRVRTLMLHVEGTMRWHRRSGLVTARVDVAGKGAVAGSLSLRWNDQARHAKATAKGVLGGRYVGLRFPYS